MVLASGRPLDKSVVLNYVLINGGLSDYTFQGGTTYYIPGPVYDNGATMIEG
jgi:hypothetical protein